MLIPSPCASSLFSLATTTEVGLELAGVPPGVLFGVVFALSTLAFRDPDLGVTLELRKFMTGVDMSFLGAAFDAVLRVGRLSFRSSGETVDRGEPASRGVRYGPCFDLTGAFGVETVWPVIGGLFASIGILKL